MESQVKINIDGISLEGILTIPRKSSGLILFAHGSGSSRFSPRNSFIAKRLQENDIGTLLIDLLLLKEDLDYNTRFNISLLSSRLTEISRWLMKKKETKDLNLGLFGASTGSAAALITSVEIGPKIKAVVSRGGRPDMADKALASVQTPTLLIVGGNDSAVIELNRAAYKILGSQEKKIEIVEGATHLFEEPGAIDKVVGLAAVWFGKYLNSSI